MKKILITTQRLDMGGVQSALIQVLNFYAKLENITIDLVLLDRKGAYAKFIPKNVKVIEVTGKTKLLRKGYTRSAKIKRDLKGLIFKDKFYKKELSKFIKENLGSYDISIAYNGYDPYFDMIAALAPSKKKYIWVHSPLKEKYENKRYFHFREKQNIFKYKKMDSVICVSKGVEESFIEFTNLKDKETVVLNNLFDYKKEVVINNKHVLKNNKHNIVLLGRVCKNKGFQKILNFEKNIYENFNFYIIGDGPFLNKIKEIIVEKKLDENIFLLGRKVPPLDYLASCDAMLMTSDYEGLGMVLLESLSVGIPIIVPNIRGAKDIYDFFSQQDQKSSILVDNNIEGYAEGLQALKNDDISKKMNINIDEYNDVIKKGLLKLLEE